MFVNTAKTILLFLALTALFLYAGKAVNQEYGIFMGIIFSLLINTFIYFFSDKLMISMYRAWPITPSENPSLYNHAQTLCQKMNIPIPQIWLTNVPIANAFAVGRNPKNASVVFTTQLLDILEPHEINGILAHELAHIKNRDTLLGMVASSMAGAIGYIGYVLRQTALVRYPRDQREEQRTPLVNFLLIIILPIGATLLRLAISRAREFEADATGAQISRDPLALISALEKLEEIKYRRQRFSPLHYPQGLMTEALLIVSPFTQRSAFLDLLSTHPPVEERIRRLKEIYAMMKN
jgi:heat shock protein HtpX